MDGTDATPGSADLWPVSSSTMTTAATTTSAPAAIAAYRGTPRMRPRSGGAPVCVGVKVQVLRERPRLHPPRRRRDHRRVVRAQLRRRDVDGHAEARGALAQLAVRRHAAADR